jgi:hypothetical protein
MGRPDSSSRARKNTSIMKINLWYNSSMRQWRWTLSDDRDIMLQESGQRPELRDAMNDVATTVEYVLQSKFPD